MKKKAEKKAKREIKNKKQMNLALENKQKAWNKGNQSENDKLRRLLEPFVKQQGMEYRDTIVLDFTKVMESRVAEIKDFYALDSATRKAYALKLFPEIKTAGKGKNIAFTCSRSVDLKTIFF